MANQVMRITLKAYDHQLVDASAAKIIETVKKNGAMVTHKRLIDILTPTQKTVDALSRLEMPAGVNIDIKMKTK